MATNLTNVELQTAFIGLSVSGTLFSALSALFGKCSPCRSCELFSHLQWPSGVYIVLFVLAVWVTFKNRTTANNKLRIITVMLSVKFYDCVERRFIRSCQVHIRKRSLHLSLRDICPATIYFPTARFPVRPCVLCPCPFRWKVCCHSFPQVVLSSADIFA